MVPKDKRFWTARFGEEVETGLVGTAMGVSWSAAPEALGSPGTCPLPDMAATVGMLFVS